MNPGSEPDRDDTGLPPVDIEIPDDARELDRDVHAYHREVRAQRRQARSSRLRGSLARNGIALPLLACCLIFALIIGTLLTVFTASGVDQGLPGTSRSTQSNAGLPGGADRIGAATPSASATAQTPALRSAQALPDATIKIGGKSEQLRRLRPAAFLLVPAGCQCAVLLGQLAALFSRKGVQTLLMPTGVPASELASAVRAGARLAVDPARAFSRYPHLGLTAILVARSGSVHYSDGLKAGDNLAGLLQAVVA